MTTKLSFKAPIDLSVGRVRISNADSEIFSWVATPDDREFIGDVRPGFYTAEISPAGVAPQSVVFEVRADQDNRVLAPPFSSLQASSGNTTFLRMHNPRPAIDGLFGGAAVPGSGTKLDQGSSAQTGSDEGTSVDDVARLGILRGEGARRLSVGLAAEAGRGTRSYVPFAAPATCELSGARLALTVSAPGEYSPSAGRRVRLSVAIEGVRVERLLLPMYRGGVQITVLPSPLSQNDVELEVLPSDARLRALARAMIAGTDDEAQAVRPLVRTVDHPPSDGPPIDPWEALLSALLSIRFPDRMPGLTLASAHRLVAMAPWAYDAHVIQARQLLYSVDTKAGAASEMRKALRVLGKAQALGAPYFSYSNQLFAQLIEALDAVLRRDGRFESAGLADSRPLDPRAGAPIRGRRILLVAAARQGPGVGRRTDPLPESVRRARVQFQDPVLGPDRGRVHPLRPWTGLPSPEGMGGPGASRHGVRRRSGTVPSPGEGGRAG